MTTPYTPSILVSTELDAINACLVAGGEAPVADIVAQRPDVMAAQQLVREASREVQAQGWRFNTEHGFEVLPAGTLTWTDSGGMVLTLNVFTPPQNLLSFSVTKHPIQQGSNYLDTIVRPSRLYQGGGVQVFYDRASNRDGHLRDAIYIDPVWLFDFHALPQAARHLVAVKAKRSYLRQVVQDYAASDRLGEDEMKATTTLRRQDETDNLNLFNNIAVRQHLGGRALRLSGVADHRASRGPLP
jgi:hypothetical protein